MRFGYLAFFTSNFFILSSIDGASATWIQPGSNVWDLDANWTAPFPNSSTDIATLGTSIIADSFISLNTTNITLNQLIFDAPNHTYTIIPNGRTLSFDGINPLIQVTGSQQQMIFSPVILNSSTTVTNNGSQPLYFSGGLTGLGGLTINGSGTIVAQGSPSTYSGLTLISSGILKTGGLNTLSPNSAYTVDGTLDLDGFSNTISSFAGSGVVTSNIAPATLTINTGTTSFVGTIINNIGLTINGAALLLAPGGLNTYLGATTITSGSLTAGLHDAFSPVSSLVVSAPGQLNLGGFNNTARSLSGNGTLSCSGGVLTLTHGSDSSTFNGTFDTGILNLAIIGGTFEAGVTSNLASGGSFKISNGASFIANTTTSLNSSVGLILEDSSQLFLASPGTFPALSLSGDLNTTVEITAGATLEVQNGIYNGTVQGSGSLRVAGAGGHLILTHANTYSGGTTIDGTLLELKGDGSIAQTASVDLANAGSVFNIEHLSSNSTSVGAITGSAGTVINLGAKQLTVNFNASTANFGGNILDGGGQGGSIVKEGSGVWVLTSSGSNYTGQTGVEGGILRAQATQALAPSSSYYLGNGATLDLNDFSNTVHSLTGQGTLLTTGIGSGGVLTISNGGEFSGSIVGTGTLGGINLLNGTLLLQSPTNSYFGQTIIQNTAELKAGVANAFSPNSDLIVAGTLSLSNYPVTINSLSGSGTVFTGGVNGTTTVLNGGSYTGSFVGAGGIHLLGGVLTLSPSIPGSINYTGDTTLSNSSILVSTQNNGLSSISPHILNNSSRILLSGNQTTLFSLASSSPTTNVELAGVTLIINGNSQTIYDGTITNLGCGNLVIQGGGSLTLTNPSNNYCGYTHVSQGQLEVVSGGLSQNTDVTIFPSGSLTIQSPDSASAVLNAGSINLNDSLALSSTFTQTTGVLNLTLGNPTFGSISSTGDIDLQGTLDILPGINPPSAGIFPILVTTTGNVLGQFGNYLTTSYPVPKPNISYSNNQVVLYFSSCNGTWINPSASSWGDGANWNSGCVPGINGNQNDTADFVPLIGIPALTVTVADQQGMNSIHPTLYQLNFNGSGSGTNYTINPFNSTTAIQLDATIGGIPQINVGYGNHTINLPINLNLNSELYLTDGATLTLGTTSSLSSLTTQTIVVSQSTPLETGTGKLINNSIASPFGVNIFSGTIENNAFFTPTALFNLNGAVNQNATLLNTGTEAVSGPLNDGASFNIGGSGTTTVSNSGIKAILGPKGKNGNLAITGTGLTVVTNSGAGAQLGPLGSGGTLLIQNSNAVVTNIGLLRSMGAFGAGGDVIISAGVVNNLLGARFHAGSGGEIKISGGTLFNDLTSKAGSSAENITLAAGHLISSGDIICNNYTQLPGGILQLNLTSLPHIFGNVSADGTASIGGDLVLNALPGFNSTNDAVVNLIYASKGVAGNYPSVNFLNFPVGFMPVVIYTPNSVQLALAPTLTPTSTGSIPTFSTTYANGFNQRLSGKLNFLHSRILRKRAKEETEEEPKKSERKSVPNPVLMQSPLTIHESSEDRKNHQINRYQSVNATVPILTAALYPHIDTLNAQGGLYNPVAAETEPFYDFEDYNDLTDTESLFNTVGFFSRRQEEKLAMKIYTKEQDTRFYIGPTASIGDFNKRGKAQIGFDFSSVGLLTGIDHAFRNWGVGGAVDYFAAYGKLDHRAGYFDLNQIHASFYNVIVPSSLPALSIDLILGASYDWYKIVRKAGSKLIHTKASGRPHGYEFDSLLGLDYIFSNPDYTSIPKELFLTPYFNVQYLQVKVDRYRERGGHLFNLKVGQQIARSLRSTLGFRLECLFESENLQVEPFFDLAWQYEFLDKRRRLRFTTTSLTPVQHLKPAIVGAGKNTLLLGLDLLFTIQKVFELETSYDLQWNSFYLIHSFYLGIGGRF